MCIHQFAIFRIYSLFTRLPSSSSKFIHFIRISLQSPNKNDYWKTAHSLLPSAISAYNLFSLLVLWLFFIVLHF